MSDIVPAALSLLSEKNKKNLRVAHQARPEDRDRVIKLYSEHNIDAEVSSFFDDVPKRISEAQLVKGLTIKRLLFLLRMDKA